MFGSNLPNVIVVIELSHAGLSRNIKAHYSDMHLNELLPL